MQHFSEIKIWALRNTLIFHEQNHHIYNSLTDQVKSAAGSNPVFVLHHDSLAIKLKDFLGN